MLPAKIKRCFRRARLLICLKITFWDSRLHALTTYRDRQGFDWVFWVWAGMLTIIGIFALNSGMPKFLTWLSTDNGKEQYLLWFGRRSLFDIVASALTFLSAVVAVFLAMRSYRVHQGAAIANRYQKGIELLGAEVDSAKLGGIELLSSVAKEAPKEYQEPVVRTLKQFLLERCAAVRTACSSELEKSGSKEDLVSIAALSAITRTNFKLRWLDPEADKNGLILRGIRLREARFIGHNFSRILFEETALGEVYFEACNFSETRIYGQCSGIMTFHNCTFKDTEIFLRKTKTVRNPGGKGNIILDDGANDEAVIVTGKKRVLGLCSFSPGIAIRRE